MTSCLKSSTSSTRFQPVPMLDFSRQFAAIGDELMQSIEQVCRSQRFILGPQVASFEQAAALACAAPHAIGCASGTDALWLALAAANIGNSSDLAAAGVNHAVITSPFSFFATASCDPPRRSSPHLRRHRPAHLQPLA